MEGVSTFLPFPLLPFPSLQFFPFFFLLPPLPNRFLPSLFPHLRSGCRLNQLGVSSPNGVRRGAPRKTNLVHSRTVINPLVAIILNMLKCMFYNRSIKIYHRLTRSQLRGCSHTPVPSPRVHPAIRCSALKSDSAKGERVENRGQISQIFEPPRKSRGGVGEMSESIFRVQTRTKPLSYSFGWAPLFHLED